MQLRPLSTVLLFWLLAAFSAAAAGAEEIRIFRPGAGDGRGGSPPGALEAALEAIRARPVADGGGRFDREALARAEVILLDDRSIEAISAAAPADLAALADAVRDGRGLVVAGRAARLLLGREELASLAGGRLLPETPGRPGPHVVAIIDQSHPVTQCVTHLCFETLYLEKPAAAAETAAGVLVLAQALQPGPPGAGPPGAGTAKAPAPSEPPLPRQVPERAPAAIWTRAAGRGQVMVLALEPAAPDAAGKTPQREEEAALAFLTARAVQWTARRSITLPIPDRMPLFAERLAAREPGPFTALADAEGFYRGRQIAPVMGYEGADWLERPDRADTELPDKVIESLGIKEGQTVADLGAGTGYFTVRMSRQVGAGGKVLAVDVQPEMIDLLRARLAREKIANVEPVLAQADDPRLPTGSVDLLLMVDVYHELSRPAKVLEAVRRSLAEGPGRAPGRMVLVEYRGEDPLVPIKPLHRLTQEQARAEIEPLGFRWVETKSFLPHQHIFIFQK